MKANVALVPRRLSDAPSSEPSSRSTQHVRTSVMHDVLDVLGDPWTLRILPAVGQGTARFETLLDALDLPRATLASRLRSLIKSGCLEKIAYSAHAARFDYRLTPKGADALEAIALLTQWNHRRAHASLEATCAACGRALRARDVKALDFGPISDRTSIAPPPKVRRGRNLLDARAKNDADVSSRITAEECIGDRWASLVIGTILFGLHRFGEIENAIAIAPNILSSRLQLLTRVGVLARRAPTVGRATYHLTAKGDALFPAIMALCAWGDRWLRPNQKSPSKKA
ncbi:MAG: helix-turn-helix domain-containing protein, partial [Polyangiaceae bacterium]